MSSLSLFESERATGPLTLLTVCTGNICRSPLAELLLQKVLTGFPITVESAGTQALVGRPMPEQNQIIAEELGVEDATSHSARQLEIEHLRGADLVLALTRDHRRAAVEMLPRVSRNVFTLREFARLADVVDLSEVALLADATAEDRLRDSLELVSQMRGTLPPLDDPADDDVVDPYRLGDEVYALSAQQIVPAVNATARFFRRATAGEA